MRWAARPNDRSHSVRSILGHLENSLRTKNTIHNTDLHARASREDAGRRGLKKNGKSEREFIIVVGANPAPRDKCR